MTGEHCIASRSWCYEEWIVSDGFGEMILRAPVAPKRAPSPIAVLLCYCFD